MSWRKQLRGICLCLITPPLKLASSIHYKRC